MNRSRSVSSVVVASALVGLCLGPRVGHAQSVAPPTADQRRQAGAAYDQAVAARAGGNFATAASLFETADRISPSPQALGNAIRSHRDAHAPSHDARAATLALRLLRRYSGDARVVEFANNAVRDLEPSLARVRVQCAGCDIEIDRALSGDAEFFVEPGHHAVVGYWGNRTRTQEFVATAGGTQDVALPTPPPEAVGRPAEPRVAQATSAPAPSTRSNGAHVADTAGRGLPPAVFITGLAATAVAGGLLIAFGVDALSGVSTYQANPTPALLSDGQSRELRTNVMIGVTAGLGVLTVGALLFTNWHGSRARVDAAPGVQTAYGTLPGLTVGGRF